MTLEWKDINIEVLNKNTSIKQKYLDLIKKCSGKVGHGEILAIMGPSGGGKTTLLNALAGRIPKGSYTQGIITYNNIPRRKNEWLKIAGFVDQDDIVHEDLSVYETLLYAARFRLKQRNLNYNKSHVSIDKNNNGIMKTNMVENYRIDDASLKNEDISFDYIIEKRIDSIIADLKLNNCSRNQMGKISGGERKRVMIGIELITDPDIIFLDEPTSGLDTLTALKICKILDNIAKNQGKIVVLTIHQPSNEIFNLFDHILLLSQGNTIFNGKVSEVESYFNNVGITKRPQITYPEFIVEICSEDFKEENPKFFYSEESIFRTQEVFKDTSIRKKTNDFYINRDFNMDHLKLLLKRKIQIEWHRKWSFLKALFFKLLTFSFSCFFNYYIFKLLTNNPLSFFGDNQEMMKALINQKNGSFEKNDIMKLIKPIAKGMITISILMMTTMLNVSGSISSFFDENRLVRREIAVGSYSTLSYLLSLLFYQISIEMICPLFVVTCYFIFLPEIIDLNFIATFLVTPFFTIPFGLFIGSISRTKQIVIILSSIFGTISSIPPNTISMLGLKYGINPVTQKLNFLGKLTWLCSLMPTFHYTGFITYLVYLKGYNLMSRNETLSMFSEHIKTLMVAQKSYIGLREIHITTLFVLMVTSPVLCIIFGVYLLGLNLMPEIRMELEKDIYSKSK